MQSPSAFRYQDKRDNVLSPVMPPMPTAFLVPLHRRLLPRLLLLPRLRPAYSRVDDLVVALSLRYFFLIAFWLRSTPI